VRTALCDLLGIEVPIVQASLGPWSSVELTAAVSNAGAIGSLGTALIPPDAIRDLIHRTRELTDRPFIVNHTARPLNEEAFAVTLEERPAAVPYALGGEGELVDRAHNLGTIRDVMPAAEIVRRLVADAEAALRRGAGPVE
jgi:nitronate monooxygenase/enoyl-[acyl-carrier protein] reductase II